MEKDEDDGKDGKKDNEEDPEEEAHVARVPSMHCILLPQEFARLAGGKKAERKGRGGGKKQSLASWISWPHASESCTAAFSKDCHQTKESRSYEWMFMTILFDSGREPRSLGTKLLETSR